MTESGEGEPRLDPWLCRTLGFGLALVTAKTVMVAQRGDVDLSTPWAVPVLLHDHLLIMLLYGGLDLFAQLRARRRGIAGPLAGGQGKGGGNHKAEAGRAMWLVLGLALIWTAASVPIAAALGSPETIVAMRAAGGVMAVVTDGLSLASGLGAVAVMALGIGGALVLARAGRRRALRVAVSLVAAIGVFGPLGRDRVDLAGLERDPFAVVIQGIWEGLRALGGG